MANANGDNGEGRSGSHAPWSGSSTPPEVYGAFARPGFDSGLLDGLESERTIEDSTLPRSLKSNRPSDLEESGDYDVNALAPLRHLLEQDWTDPNVRSRLKSKESRDDDAPLLSPTASTAGVAPPRRTWDYDFGENPADVETVVVPVVTAETEAPSTPAAPVPEAPPVAAPSISAPPPPPPPPSAPPSPPIPEVPAVQVPPDPAPSEPAPIRKRSRALPWLLAAGVVAVAVAFAVPPSAFAPPPLAEAPIKFMLVSQPEAEVFQGETSLGTTPLLLEPSQVGEGLTLRKAGFQNENFQLDMAPSQNRIEKYKVVLDVAAVPLEWSGLPEGSGLAWQGKPAAVKDLATAMPGTYSLKVSPPKRPAVTLSLAIPAPGDPSVSGPYKVGEQVAEALSKQPALSMTLKSGKGKAPKQPLTVTVEQTAGGKFQTTTPLQAKSPSDLVLPGPGTYRVKVAATKTHKALQQTVTVKESDRKVLELALTPIPPKVAKAAPRPSTGGGGGGGYVPPPVYYPPPVYSGGGGGGGGGGGASIAPPSF